ncbi:MAG: hypothetical protein P4L61_01795 [Candidatus Pacebacteria bacterium]|nr:hypothetical protein [Candidatus Paceibacterota bacterium]
MTRKNILLVVLLLVMLSIAFLNPYGFRIIFQPGYHFDPTVGEIAFVVALILVAVCGSYVSNMRSQIRSCIDRDPELVAKFAPSIAKHPILMFSAIYLVYFSFKKADSVQLKNFAIKMMIGFAIWIPLVLAMFALLVFIGIR